MTDGIIAYNPVGTYKNFSIYRRGLEYFVPAADKLKKYRSMAAAKRSIDLAIRREKP